MFNSEKHLEKFRLGRLLVNRGYITNSQLESALQEQARCGMKLGEVLIAQGLLSERELVRTLKHQSRCRYAAAVVAIAVAPFQPQVAFGAVPAENSAQPGQMAELGIRGLQQLSETQMASVSAKGINGDVQVLYRMLDDEGDADSIQALWSLSRILFPVWQVLDADISVHGIYYSASRSALQLVDGGGFALPLPNLIEEVRFDNIRVSGMTGPSFGNIVMTGIRFHDNASLVVRPN